MAVTAESVAQIETADRILEQLPPEVTENIAKYREAIESAEGKTHEIVLDPTTLTELARSSLAVIGDKVSTEGFAVTIEQSTRRDNEASLDVMRVHADKVEFTIPTDIEDKLPEGKKLPAIAKPFLGIPLQLEGVDLNFTNMTTDEPTPREVIGFDSVGPDIKASAPKNPMKNVAIQAAQGKIPGLVASLLGGTKLNDQISKTLLLPNIFGGVATGVSLRIGPEGVAAKFTRKAPVAKAA